MNLQDYRKQIDAIDDELVRLFKERMEVARKIAEYKKEHDLPVLNAGREQEKLEDISLKAGDDMQVYAGRLYKTIFELSREYQEDCISGEVRHIQ